MIKVEHLTFDYPGKRALDDISFLIEPQTITALVGPNGAGKTTLLRTLAALDTPLSGSVHINHINALEDPKAIHNQCSFLSDFYGLYDALTVIQCLTFTALSHHLSGSRAQEQINDTLIKLELQPYKDALVNSLSRGWRQRLAIAQSILYQPKVLLLDEPASGLDPDARSHLSKLLLKLCAKGMTIVVSSHILSELEDYSTHMLMIKQGKIVKHCNLKETTSSEGKKLLKICLTEVNETILGQLKAIDGINILSINDKEIIVTFNGEVSEQHQLLKQMMTHNLPVYSIHPLKTTMAEVYLSTSQKKGEKNHDSD